MASRETELEWPHSIEILVRKSLVLRKYARLRIDMDNITRSRNDLDTRQRYSEIHIRAREREVEFLLFFFREHRREISRPDKNLLRRGTGVDVPVVIYDMGSYVSRPIRPENYEDSAENEEVLVECRALPYAVEKSDREEYESDFQYHEYPLRDLRKSSEHDLIIDDRIQEDEWKEDENS